MFLEIHQPVGKGEVAYVKHGTILCKGSAIFAMGIDHHNVTFGRKVANPVENQGGAGRLARAGRAQQGEMLTQHRIDIERGTGVSGGVDCTNLHMGPIIRGVDLLHVCARYREDLRARCGIAGDAAAEVVDMPAGVVLLPFSKEVHVGDDEAAVLTVERHAADAGDQPCRADAHLDLATHLSSHCSAWIMILRERGDGGCVDQHLGTGAGDLEHGAYGSAKRRLRKAMREFGSSWHVAHTPPSISLPARTAGVRFTGLAVQR